jgi:hypothetical protein
VLGHLVGNACCWIFTSVFLVFQGGGDGACCPMGCQLQIRLQNVSQHLDGHPGPLSAQNICPKGLFSCIRFIILKFDIWGPIINNNLVGF